MSMDIKFSKTLKKTNDALIIPVFEGEKTVKTAHIDKANANVINAVLKRSQKFSGKNAQVLNVFVSDKQSFGQVILLGLGKAKDLKPLTAEKAGGSLVPHLKAAGVQNPALFFDDKFDEILAAHVALGVLLRSYTFERYKTNKRREKTSLKKIDVVADHGSKISKVFKPLRDIADGVFAARDLVNEPPSHLYPESFAQFIKSELTPLGVKVTILDEKKMEKMGMGAIIGVGKGSQHQPRMVIMEWGTPTKTTKTKKKGPVALVGKGVTFDTGGISIKPGAGMQDMKMDMGGAAAVVGTMKTLALRKSKSHVVGIVGLAENMPSSEAYKPADILTSLSGKTIEILNTDAEGRLVLADALTHVQKTYAPHTVIDLATLTGAMMVALAHEYCGTFVNHDTLWKELENASAETGEKLWRMPLDEVWMKEMESDTADIQNMAKNGRYGGACTAAGFLEHFIEDNVRWAHLDIAGTAWIHKDSPTCPKFGTGFGVRILDRWIASNYE